MFGFDKGSKPGPVIAPRPCHCEERSNPSAVVEQHGLPRRCAPRNDGRSRHCAPPRPVAAPWPRHRAPAPSLCPRPRHCEERSNPWAVVEQHGLPRRCAPRNDGRSRHCAPPRPVAAPWHRHRPVIARNEAIHRRLYKPPNYRNLVGFEVQPAFALEARAQRVPIEARLLGRVAQGQHHALFHGFEAADVKAGVRIL